MSNRSPDMTFLSMKQFKQKFKAASRKTRLLVFVGIFAALGGAVLLFRSFALSPSPVSVNLKGDCSNKTLDFVALGQTKAKVCKLKGGLFKVLLPSDKTYTTHGPDYFTKEDLKQTAKAGPDTNNTTAIPSNVTKVNPVCAPAGTKRIQVIYMLPSGVADRRADLTPAIRDLFKEVNGILNRDTNLNFRVACDGSNQIDVGGIPLSTPKRAAADEALADSEIELQNRGYNDANTKYWLWYDNGCATSGSTTCYNHGSGISDMYIGDAINTAPTYSLSYGSLGDIGAGVIGHEGTHAFGAVQSGAPNYRSYDFDGNGSNTDNDGGDFHSNQIGDALAFGYNANAGGCGDFRFDCGFNDYLSVNPDPGTYLYNSPGRNIARSQFVSDPPEGAIYTSDDDNAAYACQYQSGWAVDQSDRTKQIPVHVYVDSNPPVGITAGNKQGDSGFTNIFHTDDVHGWAWTIPDNLKNGASHKVDFYAIDYPDPGTGPNTYLGSRTITCAAPVSTGTGTGLKGVYYDNLDFTGYKFDRIDTHINNDYGSGSPDNRIGADTFSIRWLGQVQALNTGTYTFYTTTDDGVRLTVNNQILIDQLKDQGPTEYSGTISLTAGQKYDIKMAYYEQNSGAVAKLAWQAPGGTKGEIPTSQLYPYTGDVVPPGPPTGLTTNGATTSSSVPLTWTAPTGEATARYRLFRNNVLINSSITSTSFNDTGLTASTSYSYYVQAIDAAGNVSDNSNTLNTSTQAGPDTTKPTAPSSGANFRITSTTTNSITLSWNAYTDNIGVTGYNVRYSGGTINTGNTTSYTVTGLSPGTSYTFYLSAHDAAANNSDEASTSGPTAPAPDTTPPSTPTGLSSPSKTHNTIALSWNPNPSGDGVTSYELTISGGTSQTINVGNVTSYNVTGLNPSTNYTFTLKAKDAANNPSLSTSGLTVQTNASPDTTAPSKPATPTITGHTSSSISFSWTANSSADGVVKYRLYRNGSFFTDVTSTSYTDSGLPESTTYSYTVTAWDAAGNQSLASDPASGTTDKSADTVKPSDPTNMHTTGITTNSISFAWNASSDNVGVKDYVVYQDGAVIAYATSTSYTASSLASGRSYTFTVHARDAAGNVSVAPSSGNSDSLTATTQTAADTQAPTVPGNITIGSQSGDCINFSFSLASDNVAVTGYKLYARYNTNGSFTVINTLAGNDYWKTSPANASNCDSRNSSSSYIEWYLTAVDSAGNESRPTSIVGAGSSGTDNTPPSTPQNFRVTSSTSTSVTFSWSASSDNTGVSQYLVYRYAQGNNNSSADGRSTTGTTLTMQNIPQGSTNTYTLYADDVAGNLSSAVSLTFTQPAGSDTQAPATVSGITASKKDSQSFNYSFILSSDNVAVTGYKMYIRLDGAGSYYFYAGLAGNDYWGSPGSRVNTYTTDSRFAGHSVEFYMTATDAAGNESPQSSIVKVVM